MRTTADLNAATWRKSSYSNGDGGTCLEVVDNFPGHVPVRDSKHPHGPALLIPHDSWTAFISGVRRGHFPGNS
ncbi:DUF397 domain-containing protein [Streptomyces sp. Pv4-95]|uniref:DUF397 domain-containing protein n=1 Tax=Streptomyces sp. Pv4-95 TaxID=3049543 RepID=UPI003891D2CB